MKRILRMDTEDGTLIRMECLDCQNKFWGDGNAPMKDVCCDKCGSHNMTHVEINTSAEESDKIYDAGFDAGRNGSTIQNSHYTLFATTDSTDRWQRGYDDGKRNKDNA